MNPYSWAFQNPDLLHLYVAFALVLVAWIYYSAMKLWVWGVSIHSAFEDKWNGGLPPTHITGDVVWFLVVTAINLVLLGAYLHVVA